jgi:antitoxin component YwqK of YwqJK toxin-antitoxin module
MEGYYADGKKNGIEKQYDPKGNLWDETIYRDGLRDGVERIYDAGRLAHII